MARKSILEREKKRRHLVAIYSNKREKIKEQIKKHTLVTEKIKLNAEFQLIPRNAFPSRLKNRCWVTGRGRGYYRDFGLARHSLREMAHAGLLPGVTKSSW
ncbi:ribosomal protein S14 (plastid) [Cryptomonas paramecium]|uniref:Small ribosomal subunit protein uS14c n=1 Tax=Cryptomonas paramaecium TaxID=2898 RepID=D2IS91_9CRYP|nr:ribosomal protein S14 [Cryptomonas paramecium]ACT46783.1 ribosomal protein S14 [Cryptomonas paramecium]BDA98012.1 ribosomal protein S14 [Cryptomonas paramecium]|mmetsp:Transcript_20767/g.57218  ORF Transcript_20767/g.57218 Transcript_20767/m.57218 type:complete len:101 (-) Transcript_20767:135-437(-)